MVGISTRDNPFNPLTNFDAWVSFDEGKGYYTCSLLARIAKVSSMTNDDDREKEIENAIDSIIDLHGDFYVKVKA